MSVEHVTQIETEEAVSDETAPPPASNDDTPALKTPRKKRLGLFHWVRTLASGVFTGLTVTILLGIVSGLAIGVVGTVYKVELETLIVYGVAAGYVSGVVAMVAAIVSGIRRTKRKKAELA